MRTTAINFLMALILVGVAIGCGKDGGEKSKSPSTRPGQENQSTEMTAEKAAAIAIKKAKGEATPEELERLQRYIEGEAGEPK